MHKHFLGADKNIRNLSSVGTAVTGSQYQILHLSFFFSELSNVLWLERLAFHEKLQNYLFIAEFYFSMLGPANLLSFCFMKLIVWGNNRYWFNSMIWMFMKARISLRTNFCSIPGMTVLDERVLSTHSKKAWWHRHTLPSSTEAHAKLVVSSLTNFRNFPTFLSDAASPLRLLALLAWAPPPARRGATCWRA